MKQTSVEWFANQLGIKNGSMLEQAKQLEKQQIIDAFDEGQEYEYQYHINSTPKFDSQTYFTETYGCDENFKQFSLYEHKETITSADTSLNQKADTLLSLREDLYEMHFHQSDREWIIDAMLDFAAMNHMYFAKSGKPILLEIDENTSDGYHTFKELYEFRKAYNVALFNEWGRYTISKPEDKMDMRMYDVHKSWRHYDGELCFGGGWFIVVAHLPEGQISNHYEAKDWDLFKIPEREKATYQFDGHTGQDVINRLLKLY